MSLATTKILKKAHNRDFSTIRKHCTSFGNSKFSANEPYQIRDAGASGRIMVLGLSRWAEKGYSYRTIQRWCKTTFSWEMLHRAFFLKSLLKLSEEYLIAGDESVIGKAGKETHGMDRFFLV